MIEMDPFELERLEEERMQREMMGEESEEELMAKFMGKNEDPIIYDYQKTEEIRKPTKLTLDNPDIEVKQNSNADNIVFKIAEHELMMMKNSGQMDYQKLALILNKLK